MKTAIKIISILMILVSLFFIPAMADTLSPSEEEKVFLSSLIEEGIPLLYETPAALKVGFYNGLDTSIPTIASEKKIEISAYEDKINKFTLSSQISPLRDAYLLTMDTYLAEIEEYATLNPSCGSCVATINEMYPSMKEDARAYELLLIKFYQEFGVPVPV